LTYTLEPAGSHGVWGLDDHSFLPYIFGSSQYCPAITNGEAMPVEGSLPSSPNPGDVAKKPVVERERKHNMYFSAIGFINDVKTGPFWEHSPILFDISGVRSGWGKINKVCQKSEFLQRILTLSQGMIKMYNAEVLSKFPVVQHFPFGSLFSWEQDPDALSVATSVHTANQPSSNSTNSGAPSIARPAPPETTRASWARPTGAGGMGPTTVPWAQTETSSQVGAVPVTGTPWAKGPTSIPTKAAGTPTMSPPNVANEGPTKVPWASKS